MNAEPKTIHLSWTSCWVIACAVFVAFTWHGCVGQVAPPGAVPVEQGTMYNLKGSNYTIHTYTLPNGERVYIYNEQMVVLPADKK